ncbi:hypothetical protein JW960_06885, partial [candidate division KSB1 bacterium]|nr:hypothetical protein [candidate division KSB1 bacterium]
DVNAVSFYLLMSTSAHHRFKPTLFVGLNCFERRSDATLLERMALRKQGWLKSQEKNFVKKELFTEKILHGVGVSPGNIRAQAAVVNSLADALNIEQGHIIVTRSVDPAWTSVFAKAAGLVLEVGGVLSHASIVAREFRLPAVTNVSGATRQIRDGDYVEVDGQKGTISVIGEQ